MLLFVGLGNPNPNNKNNRHNVGFHVIDAINKLFSTHKGRKFTMNISGSISQKDKIPGFAYYRDEAGNYHRENPAYHPDQRINISMVYEDQKDELWKNNFESIHNEIKSQWNGNPQQPNILDVGCNMGIFVNGMNDKGFTDITGYDINRMSVDRGKEVFKDVADKFGNKNNLNRKIDELNQETETLIDEIEKWQT